MIAAAGVFTQSVSFHASTVSLDGLILIFLSQTGPHPLPRGGTDYLRYDVCVIGLRGPPATARWYRLYALRRA